MLAQPLPQVSMLFWSGITKYNLCQEFSCCQDALKFFEFDKKFHADLSSRVSLWCKVLDINMTPAAVPVQTKKRNRRKGAKSAPEVTDQNEDETVLTDPKELDVNNRFAMLSL